MCNLYAQTKDQAAIREMAKVVEDLTGNLQPLPAIYPDTAAPIVCNGETGRRLILARWGMPSPAFAVKGRNADKGITNIRNTASPHWRRWLSIEHRCVVPWTAFSEYAHLPDGSKPPVWFALDDSRPLAFFAGVWARWRGTRIAKEGEIEADVFGFLTTEANQEVAEVHPKAMPVVLRDAGEIDHWMTAPTAGALALQRPLPDCSLRIVMRGTKKDR